MIRYTSNYVQSASYAVPCLAVRYNFLSVCAHPTRPPFSFVHHHNASAKRGLSIFILYRAEKTTWDDSVASPVRRNRITFMGSFTSLTQFEMTDVQIHLAQVPDEDANHPVE
jgi:hypothetical protein